MAVADAAGDVNCRAIAMAVSMSSGALARSVALRGAADGSAPSGGSATERPGVAGGSVLAVVLGAAAPAALDSVGAVEAAATGVVRGAP
jgi:hypothetical protein